MSPLNFTSPNAGRSATPHLLRRSGEGGGAEAAAPPHALPPFPRRAWGLAAAIGALGLDQATKLLMLYGLHFKDMAPGSGVPVLPFFNLVMVWNPGVSYGLFPAHGPWGTAVLALFSLAV